MNPLTLEWVNKAEGDFYTAKREVKVRKFPNYDGVCFNCQQVAEKYLKAFLQENSQAFPKTHILMDLLALCIKIEPSFQLIQTELNILEGYAVQIRYPGESADNVDAKAAFKTASIAREFIRHRLGLE
ncbi:MAG: HEPN domain-containing protein [Anaerolineaceae bacterium]|nr:HEPN domain-containing protein [Anaerolineaceae bacterium]